VNNLRFIKRGGGQAAAVKHADMFR
jgi:hypothetical protein